MALVSGFDLASTNGSGSPTVSSNGVHFPSSRGKSVPNIVTIPIKFEELFYNKAAEPFRVICIEHPVTGRNDREGDLARLSAIRTFDDCQLYLNADPVNRFVLMKMETSVLLDFVAEFARGPRTEDEIAKSTQKLVEHILQQLICANMDVREMKQRPSLMKQFEVIVETWTLGRVGPTVMSALMQSFELMDREIHRVLRANQGITLHNLNLRPELICDFSTAIEMTSSHFDRITSPMEKLLLLQEIIENIQKTIEMSFSRSTGGRIADNVLASDDLIPIIVFVLLQAKPQHLNSTLYYVKHFTRFNLTTSQLGFHLTTFAAAAEFIKTDHLPQSGFASGSAALGDYIAHPLDPVRSPHFDPFAAGIQPPPSAGTSFRENRRSMSYITPPVASSTISTGRSFGTKSSSSSTTPQPFQEPMDYGWMDSGSAAPRPSLSRSISSYDHRAAASGALPPANIVSQPSAAASAPRRSNYGSMGDSPQPVYTPPESSYRSGVAPLSAAHHIHHHHQRIDSAPPTSFIQKSPESITISPEEAQSFFSNLKSYGRGGK